jgi:predicted esterase
LHVLVVLSSRYDITGLDERSNEKCKGLPDAVQRIAGILKTEHETNGLPYSRMVLAGFSQGGALSVFTGFSLPQKLAGIVCLSGYLPAASQFKITSGLESTPVLHCHGTQDMVVNHALAGKSREKVLGYGATDYTIESYPIGHTVSMDELRRVQDFLLKVLPDDPSVCIQLKDPAEMSVKELKQALRKAGLSSVGLMEKSEFVKILKDHRENKL